MIEYMNIKDGPVIEGMESEEVVYAALQPQYLPLRSLRSKSGRVISRWTFTPEQRQAIANGADILLELSTFGHPLQPIRMAISDGRVDNDWVRVCLLEGVAKKTGGGCICAQGITYCPAHGDQPAKRGICPKCGAVLGYCMEGEYCTSGACNYAY